MGVVDPVKGGANYVGAYVNARTLSFNGDLSIVGVTFRYARARGMQQKRGAMRISRATASPAERIDGPLRLRTVKGRPDAPKNKRATVIWASVCRLRTQTRQIFASASRCSEHAFESIQLMMGDTFICFGL